MSKNKVLTSKQKIGLILLLGFLILGFEALFIGKIFPGIFIAETNLGALTSNEAQNKLKIEITKRLNKPLYLTYQGQIIEFNLNEEDLEIDYSGSINEAFEYGRRRIYTKPVKLPLNVTFNPSFEEKLQKIALDVNQPSFDAQLKIDDLIINVTPSQEGVVLDKEKLEKQVIDYINSGKETSDILPTKIVQPKLSYLSALAIKKSLDQIKLSPINLTFNDKNFPLDLATVLTFIDLEDSQPSLIRASILDNPINIASLKVGEREYLDSHLNFDEEKIASYLEQLATSINREVEEPLFNFDGKKVVEFRPPQEGRNLKIKESTSALIQNLISPKPKDVELVVGIVSPKNKLTNDLGIKELIGSGISNFSGSIPNRIYNINLAASRVNGILVAPGDTFSFNERVGDISGASGYKQAYVIKSGRTVLDDGGGVCQVSTTLFRAVLNSGLPVVERVAHAYRVGYYEQGFPPGLDATIFSPSVDFKFKNDTEHHILIQAYTYGSTLYFDLYGTKDGRVAKLSTPIVTNVTPPPPELRQDDPSLPKGEVKQVDFPAWGANVSFSRTVTKDGVVYINETFKSNFRPWQAVYLVGTGG